MTASELWSFQPTIPAGTAIATPFRQALTIPVRKVDRIEVTVPPGPSGLMGFAITMGGINVVPIQAGSYLVVDNIDRSWDMDGLPTSGAWQFSGYNLGVWDHTVYVRMLVELTSANANPPLLSSVDMMGLSS